MEELYETNKFNSSSFANEVRTNARSTNKAQQNASEALKKQLKSAVSSKYNIYQYTSPIKTIASQAAKVEEQSTKIASQAIKIEDQDIRVSKLESVVNSLSQKFTNFDIQFDPIENDNNVVNLGEDSSS